MKYMNFCFEALLLQTEDISSHVVMHFIGVYAKLARSDYQLRYVCPSVLKEEPISHWTDFH
jgi:hypothetical protein